MKREMASQNMSMISLQRRQAQRIKCFQQGVYRWDKSLPTRVSKGNFKGSQHRDTTWQKMKSNFREWDNNMQDARTDFLRICEWFYRIDIRNSWWCSSKICEISFRMGDKFRKPHHDLSWPSRIHLLTHTWMFNFEFILKFFLMFDIKLAFKPVDSSRET